MNIHLIVISTQTQLFIGVTRIAIFIFIPLIIVLVFGTKRLRNIGGDLGAAVKGFKKGMDEAEEAKDAAFSPLPDTEEKDAGAEKAESEKDRTAQ